MLIKILEEPTRLPRKAEATHERTGNRADGEPRNDTSGSARASRVVPALLHREPGGMLFLAVYGGLLESRSRLPMRFSKRKIRGCAHQSTSSGLRFAHKYLPA